MQIVGDWRPHTRLVRRISVCNEMCSSTDTLQCTYISETRCHEMHFADHKYLELHLRQELRPVPRWWLPPAPYSFIERAKEGNGYWGKERKAIGGDEGNKEEETGGSPTHISPAHASAEKGVLIEKNAHLPQETKRPHIRRRWSFQIYVLSKSSVFVHLSLSLSLCYKAIKIFHNNTNYRSQ